MANNIKDLPLDVSLTRRATAQGLERYLFERFDVLDHGFVRVVDYMGDDAAVVQAARVSYGRGTKKALEDDGLIRYLMRHHHTTPFEMCEIKLHVKLPIFVARQWIRHRTANVNEYSARYSVLDKEFYLPNPEDLAKQSTTNKQGRGAVLEPEEAAYVIDVLRQDAEQTYGHYEAMLGDDIGLSRELARMNLTLNTYTQWYWKTDLHNLFHFLRLRVDPHAQQEIRDYAAVIIQLVAAWVPSCYKAFVDYQLHARTFSGPVLDAIRVALKYGRPLERPSQISAREWQETIDALETL